MRKFTKMLYAFIFDRPYHSRILSLILCILSIMAGRLADKIQKNFTFINIHCLSKRFTFVQSFNENTTLQIHLGSHRVSYQSLL